MDGRKNSLGMMVVAAALMVGAWSGAARGEAMAKASIDPNDNPAAKQVTTSAPENATHADDLPAAFRLPAATVARPVVKEAAAEKGDLASAASAKTGDVDAMAGVAAVNAAEAPATPVEKVLPKETPKLSELEASPIHASTPAAPVKGTGDAAAPAVTHSSMSGVTNALQVGTALVVVIGLIFIGKALAKKFVPGAKASNGKGVIEILARYPLCKNQSLVLVRIGSQIVTLNQCKDSSQSVLVISDANEVAKLMGQIEGQSPNSIQAGFTKLLSNARMDLEDPANDPDRNDFELRSMEPENLDNQLEEMASAKRQLMQLRQQVRSVRDSLPRS